MTTKQPFLLNEASDFERLGGGRVRFTVFCVPARAADYRMGLYELCVEAVEGEVVDVDPLHGFDDDEKPLDLTLGESSDLERWALYGSAVQQVADNYFQVDVEGAAYASA